MLTTCLMGQTRPAARASPATATWPPRSPASRTSAAGPTARRPGPFGAYTDYIAPRFNAVADPGRARAPPPHRRGPVHRPLAGRGVAALPRPGAPRLRRERPRAGTRRQPRSRAGAARRLPGAGDDRWVAIAVARRRAGARSCDVMGRPELAADAALRQRRRRGARTTTSSTPRSPRGRAPHDAGELERAAAGARRRRAASSRTAPSCAPTRSSAIAATSSTVAAPDAAARRPSRARASGSRARRRRSTDPRRPSGATTSGCSPRSSATTTSASPSS